MTQKINRLEQDTKVALSQIISYEMNNPSVTDTMISVTDVKITPDQKYAKVYVSIFGKQDKQKVLLALQESNGFIKNELAKKVKFRNIPSITFLIDDSIDYGNRMDKLIKEVIKEDQEQKND